MDIKTNLKYFAIFVVGLGLAKIIRKIFKSRVSTEKAKLKKGEHQVIREQLKRNYEFFGDKGMNKITDSFVIVVGIGGVGSHAVMTLIRSGVSRIRVIDYDIVTLSSLNRHAFAIRKDVGRLKVKVVEEYAKEINPSIIIESIDDAFLKEYADKYLQGNPDYVIDCIDDLESKCDLLKYCQDHNLRVISSMGAGGRIDPTAIRIANFDFIKGENLARRLRVMYKKKYNEILPNIKCIYSIEKPFKGLSDLEPHQKENPEDFRVNFNERVRSIPVFASLPAIFGQSLASAVLADLADIQLDNLNKEEDVDVTIGNIAISKLMEDFKKIYKEADMGYDDFLEIAEKFNKISAISQKLGSKMRYEIFNKEKGLVKNNIIILSRSEQNKHQDLKTESDLIAFYSQETYDRITKTLNN